MQTELLHDLGAGDYNEFAGLPHYAEGIGLSAGDVPPVHRRTIETSQDDQISALRWGTSTPEVVFLDGGAQESTHVGRRGHRPRPLRHRY
jgi:hypothetical protein